MTFRQILFWVHLGAGLIAGVAIGIMCFTGTALAFEKDLIAWAERDARQIATPPTGQPRLTIDEMQARLRSAHPGVRPSSIVVHNDPHAAVAFTAGRTDGLYVNPYTGEVRQPRSKRTSRFMQVMIEWHRYLGLNGEQSRPRGKLINGICNLAFCLLAVTGLYLWMPRQWSWRAVRPVIWFRQNSSAKARDFNWHNAIGFWSAPVLIVLTLTAVPISFRWGTNVIHAITGVPISAASAAPAAAPSLSPALTSPAAGTSPLPLDALFATAQKAVSRWQTITLRFTTPTGNTSGSPAGRASHGANADERASNKVSAPQPVNFTIREANSWPRTATTTLAVDPVSGAILGRTSYATMNAAQRVRAWTRFLHTGEAVGPLGQLLAGLASLGGTFLVYTGFALSWRRFTGKGS